MSKAVFNNDGKWSKGNIYFDIAIMSIYKLGGFQLAILSYIVNSYNREVFSYREQKACKISYSDLVKRCNCAEKTVRNAIQVLLDEQLIKCINSNTRRGRNSYYYIPNETKINQITNDYLADLPEDKENE